MGGASIVKCHGALDEVGRRAEGERHRSAFPMVDWLGQEDES